MLFMDVAKNMGAPQSRSSIAWTIPAIKSGEESSQAKAGLIT